MKRLQTLIYSIALATGVTAQVNYTANDKVVSYAGKFRMGINMGYYPGWDNKTLADIAAGNPAVGQKGIGAKGNRTGMPEILLDYYGYGLVETDIAHWNKLGMGEYTAILGGPSGLHQDYSQHCPGQFSSLFANLYTPIWDGGANGTPYNDNNYWAAYVYKAASQYKDQVRFWEIWNEPGFDLTGNLGWRDDQYPGNWWKEGPNPCDYILRAPIYHYIRTLRVAWEVIKTVDPDGYVCLGSVGYQSLLNAILSNTDNPNQGDVSAAYPLTGGAYFDCISFHSYPHFDGSTTNFGLGIFRRHSDAAADGLNYYRGYYQTILDQYGYDGNKYPKKEWIVTEINAPRKAYSGPFFGGKDAQINHMMKAYMVGKVDKFNQLHVFQLADQRRPDESDYEFHQMGLYAKFENNVPYNVKVNDEGIALKTMTDLIHDTEHDPARTMAMNLPAGVRGYAFKRPNGTWIYAIWARTATDLSEAASATYSFPANFNLNNLTKYTWDYGYSGITQVAGSQNIQLDARPVFFADAGPSSTACQLNASVSNIACNDNGTPSNAADDTYSFSLAVSGTNASATWNATVNGKSVDGPIGGSKVLGPFAIALGKLDFSVRDALKAECQTQVSVTPPATCSTGGGTTGTYCTGKSDFPWHDWIAGIDLGGLKYASGKSPYSDFTAQTIQLGVGSTNPVALTAGFSWFGQDEAWRVWIDFNKNNQFESSEMVFEGIQKAPVDGTLEAVFKGTLNIPANAPKGSTRLRVSMKRGNVFANPCETFPNGEVEDYTIVIGDTSGGGGTGGGNPTPNCASKSDFPWHDWIARVQLANLDQASQKAAYTQYPTVANLKVGGTFPLVLTTGFSWFTHDEYYKVWIDYNQNGVFEEPQEIAYQGILAKPVDGTLEKSLVGNISVPASAKLGNANMRVSMKRDGYATPCETLPYGEVEDYTVNLAPAFQTADRPTNIGSDLVLYPNPATGAVLIGLRDYAGRPVQITLLNALGQVVRTVDLGDSAPVVHEFSLEGVTPGHYLVSLRVLGEAPLSKKLTIKD